MNATLVSVAVAIEARVARWFMAGFDVTRLKYLQLFLKSVLTITLQPLTESSGGFLIGWYAAETRAAIGALPVAAVAAAAPGVGLLDPPADQGTARPGGGVSTYQPW